MRHCFAPVVRSAPAAGMLLLFLALQLAALRVSFVPGVERDPWAAPRADGITVTSVGS